MWIEFEYGSATLTPAHRRNVLDLINGLLDELYRGFRVPILEKEFVVLANSAIE